ncbi:MAG: M20/M25/M40 family metallo-hydrolase [Defluviitaleaceae bacterium]|nr:M20/M25/M40 family metallo-hydrolase [Defluviitaleaceae bacterium]
MQNTVLKNFFEISKVPRGSGNEKAVSDFIANFARERGADVIQDELHNLIIKKPGTLPGRPAVILQAHLDMVCEKNVGKVHDFDRDPIDAYIDGDFVKAHGTTLGADNGIGVAMCMALLDADFQHPPLEIVLTTDEEAGMTGAQHLDVSLLSGRRMINLDSADESTFTMGCAAAVTAEVVIHGQCRGDSAPAPPQGDNVPLTPSPETARCAVSEKSGGSGETFSKVSPEKRLKITITGLKGGHSGSDIDSERGNAIRILGFVLDAVCGAGEVRIASISGGMKVNAIPREAECVIIFSQGNEGKILAALEDVCEGFLKQFRSLKIGRAETDLPTMSKNNCALSPESSRALCAALMLLPNGVAARSLEIEGLVNASCNIGVIEMTGEGVKISLMARGATRFFTQQAEAQISAVAAQIGADVSFVQRSPAWVYNPDSPLLKTAEKVYARVFSAASGECADAGTCPRCSTRAVRARATAVHAGLECGIFIDKIPGLDIISFGPNMYDYHTPDERLSISSTERVREFLFELLAEL